MIGQAIKNLRYLDRINLAEALLAGANKKVGTAVWKEGVRTTRKRMAAALESLKANYRRRVVVLQPRVTSRARRALRDDRAKGIETPRIKRMRQLDTLLVGAQAECRALQADLLVVGESIA